MGEKKVTTLKKEQIGTCRLCLEEAKLCNSHILSEFFYKPMYDEKHRALKFTREPYNRNYIQKGFREYLLCKKCEAHINKYESYMAEVWKLPKLLPQNEHLVQELDYNLFKLFHLSVLWRASISSHEVFRNVNLGPHEERLRRMILDDIPGKETQYRFFGEVLVNRNEVLADVVMEPIFRKIEAHRVYLFIFGGCVWCYFVSSHLYDDIPKKFYICHEGNITLGKKQFTDLKFITDFAVDILRNEINRKSPKVT